MSVPGLPAASSQRPLPFAIGWSRLPSLPLPRLVALAAAGVGVAVLAGWVLRIEALLTLAPGLVAMKANTALCFLLVGVALWPMPAGAAALARVNSVLCGAIVAIVASATVVEYATRWDLRLDQAIVFDYLVVGDTAPGRMALATALAFVLTGTSLMLLGRQARRTAVATEWLPGGVALLAIPGLLGYAYNLEAFRAVSVVTMPMALHTSILFVLVAAALAVAAPASRLTALLAAPGLGGTAARRLLPTALGFPLAAGWALQQLTRAGLISTTGALTIFATGSIAILGGLVLWNAGWIEAADGERREAQETRARLAAIVESSSDAIISFEAALRTSEERLRLVTDHVQDMVSQVDLDGTFVYASPSHETVLGYAPQSLVGTGAFSHIPAEDVARIRRLIVAAMRDGRTERFEYRYRHADGHDVEVEAVGKLLFDPSGRATGAVVSARDISARKALEQSLRGRTEELERANQHLRRVIAEREDAEAAVRHLEQQFFQAQKMEAIGRLAGGVAHDFNNILTAILGYSDVILDRAEPGSELAGDVNEIKAAGERAAGLTRQLLYFSRKQMIVPRLLDLNGVVGGMEKMLRRLIGEDVQLVLSLGADLHLVRSDPGLIEQVVLNLVVNARDAMPEGGTVTIRTENRALDAAFTSSHPGSRSGDHVAIVVSDTGVGMPRDVVDHIFEPFFTTKVAGKGTGLGLSTVYTIVKQSQGYITVASCPGAGTTFTTLLPRVAGTAEDLPVDAPALPSLRGTDTILLVEDESFVRNLIRRALEPRGYVLLEADSASRALSIEKAHDGPIHLVLTDIIMPGMNGPALCADIGSRRKNLKVLYISGFADHTGVDLEGISQAGAFLQKPFTAEALATKIRQVLDAGGPRDGVAAGPA